ncbi:hypothetical protein B296_00011204, partial [Ensete ventricosum]
VGEGQSLVLRLELGEKEREKHEWTNLMKLRSDYKDAFVEKHGVKLGLMSGFVKGLVVPVIRNADGMNFAEIEKEINTLAKKANNGTISIDEMAGGTFTISNGGVYGSLLSTPIINPPQVMHLNLKKDRWELVIMMYSDLT